MTKMVYEIEGEQASSLKDLATLLGVEKVTKKDVSEGGQYFDIVNLVEVESEDGVEKVDKSVIYSTVSDEDIDLTPEQVEESMPKFESLDELKEFITDLDTPTLEYLAKGLELAWTPTYHANIHRMRIAMAMHRYFFPEMFKSKELDSKKAKYGDFETEHLVKLAKDSEVEFTPSDNEAINRMRVIMALKEAGHLEE